MAAARITSRRTHPAANEAVDPGFPLDQKLHNRVERSWFFEDWRRITAPKAVKLPMKT